MPPDIVPVTPAGASWLQTWVPLIGVVLAFIAAIIAPTLAIVITGAMARGAAARAAEATTRVEKKLDETTSRTDAKLNRIDSMVDGRLTTALQKIDQLESRIETLTGRRQLPE